MARTSNLKIAGSSPALKFTIMAAIIKISISEVARTSNLKIAGSIKIRNNGSCYKISIPEMARTSNLKIAGSSPALKGYEIRLPI
ncbi:hypothetical protein U3516DRAFT_765859 [Neocallimastix sp. 'constans']